jgi:hypothetical protein
MPESARPNKLIFVSCGAKIANVMANYLVALSTARRYCAKPGDMPCAIASTMMKLIG